MSTPPRTTGSRGLSSSTASNGSRAGSPARPPADAAGAGRAGRPDRQRRTASDATRPCGCGPTCSARPACRSITAATCRSSRTRPTKAACYFDMLVAASNVYSGSWLEGSGAVYAENQALRWIADLAGLPAEAGGTFVQGGTVGNLSALVAAREAALERRGRRPARWAVCVTEETHSSVKHALQVVMDVEVVEVPGDERGRMTGAALRATVVGLPEHVRDGIFAVVATAGTTNLGVVDDIAGIAAGRPRARLVAARRRRVRRRRPGRAVRAAPVRRRRARRLVHRRPAQVAVRAVRRVRAALPRPAARTRRAHPARRLPRSGHRRRRVEPVRLRDPADPPGARACRSGSPSPSTAPTPTATRSSRR